MLRYINESECLDSYEVSFHCESEQLEFAFFILGEQRQIGTLRKCYELSSQYI